MAAAMAAILVDHFAPEFLAFENESANHAGPATDSHFKLVLVAAAFEGRRLVQRHQAVYGLLAEFLASGVHALSLHLFTGDEWLARAQAVAQSPDCRGGSGRA